MELGSLWKVQNTWTKRVYWLYNHCSGERSCISNGNTELRKPGKSWQHELFRCKHRAWVDFSDMKVGRQPVLMIVGFMRLGSFHWVWGKGGMLYGVYVTQFCHIWKNRIVFTTSVRIFTICMYLPVIYGIKRKTLLSVDEIGITDLLLIFTSATDPAGINKWLQFGDSSFIPLMPGSLLNIKADFSKYADAESVLSLTWGSLYCVVKFGLDITRIPLRTDGRWKAYL